MLHYLSFACNPAFCFSIGKKLVTHISFSYTCFIYYRKHPNNDNMICRLPSSACFQQHCHEWSFISALPSVLRNKSDLPRLEWRLFSFNFGKICNLTNRHKLFSIPVAQYVSFSHHAKTYPLQFITLIL